LLAVQEISFGFGEFIPELGKPQSKTERYESAAQKQQQTANQKREAPIKMFALD
jgi:hypothetical protein